MKRNYYKPIRITIILTLILLLTNCSAPIREVMQKESSIYVKNPQNIFIDPVQIEMKYDNLELVSLQLTTQQNAILHYTGNFDIITGQCNPEIYCTVDLKNGVIEKITDQKEIENIKNNSYSYKNYREAPLRRYEGGSAVGKFLNAFGGGPNHNRFKIDCFTADKKINNEFEFCFTRRTPKKREYGDPTPPP